MSFSKDVKKELSKLNNLANKEEVKYEFLGYLISSNIAIEKEYIKYSTENEHNIDRFAKIIRNIEIEQFEININGKIFFIKIPQKEIKNLYKKDPKIENLITKEEVNSYLNQKDQKIETNSHLNQKDQKIEINLQKAFIRGLYMGAGSINNPQRKYHIECGIKNKSNISPIAQMLKENSIIVRQGENTIYIKEGEEISKFLAFIGAEKSVLKFEEIRVQRQMNNKVNRLVNCKSANLNKVLNASVEQVDAIRKLKQNGEFEKLDDSLKEIAELRLQNPDMPLIELGKMLSKPIGKSGVNYRLKKIIQTAKLT